jgi:Rhodopirellula transposase DDE domain
VVDEALIGERYRALAGELDERRRRLWAAAEARAAGRGGIAAVVRATGISESTVRRGLSDLQSGEVLEPGMVRRLGSGRRPLEHSDPTLIEDLERLVDPATRGDPESPLRWTSKSGAKLAVALREMGHEIVDRTVLLRLKSMGYRLQANQKTREGADHPDRDAQFAHIAAVTGAALQAKQPVISIDTKKKELIGDYKAVGRELQPTGVPVQVQGHDFPDPQVPKVIPYGIYDTTNNEGWVNVGISADTAQFSVASIRAWWGHLGRERFPDAKTLTITADCGGSNNPRVRLWKTELQRLADDTGLTLEVCHFPPGTSKWNKVEHRLFSFISLNWRGKPLTSYQVVIELIAATTTNTGLNVFARLDDTTYPQKLKITDEQIAAVNITGHQFHPEWNYSIHPSLTDS